jgi:glycosyltransferase involved in cell wall biosynthesis
MMVGEAMACGLPFIAYPIGIAPDFVRNNSGGTLVEKIGDVVTLATAIKFYVELTEKDLIQRKHAAAESAQELLSSKRFIENIKNVISK